jgi:hypothetical protein
MVEHNPPPSADSARPPVNPCQSRSMSPMNSFLSSTTGTALPQLFDPLGEARSIEGKRARCSRSEFRNGLAHTPRLVAKLHDRPNADFHLIANG